MKTLSVALIFLLAPAFALGKTFVCDVHSTATFTPGGWEKGAPFVWDNDGDFFAGNCASHAN
jgi:hypothetical protein